MKNIILGFMMVVGLAFAAPAPAMAQTANSGAKQQVCQGIQGQTGGSCTAAGSITLNNALKAVLNILSFIAGIAAVIMIILSGLKYITSGGDSSSIASAKSGLIYAIVGLIVVAMSQFIVRFVLETV